MAHSMSKDAMLEGILNRDLASMCELSVMLGAAPENADWKSTVKSKKKFLGRLKEALLSQLVEFVEVQSKIKVPGRHADRIALIPDTLAKAMTEDVLRGIDEDDWDDEDYSDLKLSDFLQAEESRLLLRWAIFDGLISIEPDSSGKPARKKKAARTGASKKRASKTGVTSAPTRGGGSWKWFHEAVAGIAGNEDAKRALYDEVYLSLVNPERLKRYGITSAGAVLMHGPPGVGKTALARELAEKTGLGFRYVSAPSLLSKYIGDAERGLRKAFEPPRNGGKVVLFIDEFDAIAPNREALMYAESAYVQQLLVLLDGFEERSGIAVIAATNRLDAIDPAVVRSGRFHPIEVTLPDAATRLKILTIHLKGRQTAPDLEMDFLVRETEDWSGAEIKGLCEAAAWLAMRREDESGITQTITDADLGIALRNIIAARRSEAA